MAVNKVVANGETLIDLSGDTVTPASLLSGIIAHDAAGNAITGIMGGNEKYLEKPYGLTDYWDFSDADVSENSWKSKLSGAAFSGSGDILLTNDFVQFDEELSCGLGEQYAYTVYAIARTKEYVSDRFILCSTSDAQTPQLNLCSNNGTLDITMSDSGGSLYTKADE